MKLVSLQSRDRCLPNAPEVIWELLDAISDGVYFVDLERRILYWNQGAARLTGYKAEEVVGKRCHDDLLCHVDSSGRRMCKQGCPLKEAVANGTSQERSAFLRHKKGRRMPVMIRALPVRGADGTIVGTVEIFSDDSRQTEARRRADAMERLAFLDHLTQLPNRRYMEVALDTALSEYRVHHDSFGVLQFDLNGFKEINDRFGHPCGDRALVEAGKTLAGALRPTDTVGRWGGDEYIAIVRNVSQEILDQLKERCSALISQTSVVGDAEERIWLSTAVGATLSQAGDTREALMERTDKLMYGCKAGGRGRCAAAEAPAGVWGDRCA